MPTYEYRCNDCGHQFELVQSMRDNPKRKCPACAKNTLERLIGVGAGIIFKGSGFYETDYRSDSYKKGAEADKKAQSPSTTSDSAKSDAGASCACGKTSAESCKSAAATSDSKPAPAKKSTEQAPTKSKSSSKSQQD